MTIAVTLTWLAIGLLLTALIERQSPGTISAGFGPRWDNGPFFRAVVVLIAALLWPIIFLLHDEK